MSKPQVLVSYHRASIRGEFVNVLRAIEKEALATNRVPLVHIETHGNGEGIGFDDEALDFPDLMRELTPLNHLTRLRLAVVLAACEGIWGIKMLQPV